MRCWPEKWQYYLDNDCQTILQILVDNQNLTPPIPYALQQISREDLLALREKESDAIGLPVYFTHHEDGFWLHPPPDKKYDLRVRYQPHVRER